MLSGMAEAIIAIYGVRCPDGVTLGTIQSLLIAEAKLGSIPLTEKITVALAATFHRAGCIPAKEQSDVTAGPKVQS
jgi:hypothetical protein